MATVWNDENEHEEALVEVLLVGDKALKLTVADGASICIIFTEEEKKLLRDRLTEVCHG